MTPDGAALTPISDGSADAVRYRAGLGAPRLDAGRFNFFQRMMLRWRELHPYSPVHVLRVPVPLDDLRGDGLRLKPQLRADVLLDLRRDVGEGTHGARQLPEARHLAGAGQALFRPPHLHQPHGQLEAERGGLSVNAVGAAHHWRALVLRRQRRENRLQRRYILQ